MDRSRIEVTGKLARYLGGQKANKTHGFRTGEVVRFVR